MKIQTLFDSRKKDEITNSSTKSRKLQKIAPQKCKHKKCSDQRSSDTSKGVNAFLEHREPMFLVMVGNLLWENLIIFHLTLFGLTADHSVRSYFTIPLTIDIYPFTFFFLLGGRVENNNRWDNATPVMQPGLLSPRSEHSTKGQWGEHFKTSQKKTPPNLNPTTKDCI